MFAETRSGARPQRAACARLLRRTRAVVLVIIVLVVVPGAEELSGFQKVLVRG
jgi:hypothetical protein